MAAPSRPTDLVSAALAATRESKRVAFVDLSSPDGSLQLVKHVAAVANSGGGVVVVTGPPELVARSAAELLDTITGHLGERPAIDVVEGVKDGARVVALAVDARTRSPLVVERSGGWVDDHGVERTVLTAGTIYFRHGGRSAPASSRDVSRFIDSTLHGLRRDLLRNVRKVSTAPTGSEVIVVPPTEAPTGVLERFRIVDDPGAPAVARTDFDVTHPHRQKELLLAINRRAGREIAGPYDIQCVRRVHRVDEHPEFVHKPKFGSPQYSDAYVSWILDRHTADPQFFEQAKALDKAHRDATTGHSSPENRSHAD